MGRSIKYMNGGKSIALDQYFIDHFRIDLLHEQYSANIDLGSCSQKSTVIELLREQGYVVIEEKDSIYTIKYDK